MSAAEEFSAFLASLTAKQLDLFVMLNTVVGAESLSLDDKRELMHHFGAIGPNFHTCAAFKHYVFPQPQQLNDYANKMIALAKKPRLGDACVAGSFFQEAYEVMAAAVCDNKPLVSHCEFGSVHTTALGPSATDPAPPIFLFNS